MSTRKADESMSNPQPVNQEEKELRELAESIWTPEELEEVRRKWDELDLAMEYSSAVDRKEAVRRFLDDQLDAATKGPFKGVPGDFPEGVSGDFLATKEDEILAELAEQRAIIDKLAAKDEPPELTREEIVTQFLENLHGSIDQVKASRLGYCNMWLDFANCPPSQWDKSLLNRYQDFLASPEQNKGKGYSKATQGKILEIAKQVFIAAGPGVKWPLGKRHTIKVRKSDMKTPALKLADVNKMIIAAKDDKLTIPQAAFLALATVYGLRREEITRIREQDIDYEMGRITIRTAKEGEEREHLLASEIVPYIERHNFDQARSPSVLTKMYREMERKADVPHMERAGYHAIRRPLDTELLRRLKYVDVKRFLRWKLSGEMPLYYDKSDPVELDPEVFRHHPFLPMWRE